MRSVRLRSKNDRISGLIKYTSNTSPLAMFGIFVVPVWRLRSCLFAFSKFRTTVVLFTVVAIFLFLLTGCGAAAVVSRTDLKLKNTVGEQVSEPGEQVSEPGEQVSEPGEQKTLCELTAATADVRADPVYRWLPGGGALPEDSPDETKNYQFTDTELDAMSNEKVGWGVKLRGHEQPEIFDSTREMLGKYNTVYIGEQGQKTLYLTFDAGYENGYTADILDTLLMKGVSAAFFITGYYLDGQEELISRMINEGHIVGNHTDKHKCLPEETDAAVEKDIRDLENAYLEETGMKMARYLRPPSGEYSERCLALAAGMGYTTVLWSFAYVDYDEAQYRGNEYAFGKITENFHDGAVILLHAESRENAAVLGRVIDEARAMGYSFSSLDTLA